jgi:hypothetical protein
MNTTESGSLLERGLILKSIKDLAPPLYKVYDTDKERMKDLLQVYTQLVSKLHERLQSNNNSEEVKDPTWIEISKDMQTLHGLMAINTSIGNFILKKNAMKARENSLPKTIITAETLTPSTSITKQPSVITVAQMKTMLTDAQKAPTTPQLVTVRARIGGHEPTAQLVRTESGPLQEAIDALQGPSPLKKKKENEESEEEDLDKTQEMPEEKDEEEKEEELQVTQPVSSSKTLKKGRKSGASASKTQEPQGKTIQEVTLDELEERSETLRIKREAEKAETRITRAQMEKWTKDPKIKDQVLIQL